jgi:transposase InsO family protein
LLHNVGDAAIEVPDHAVCLRVAGRRQAMLEVQRQACFVEDMLTRQQIAPQQLTLHSDHGAPMKGEAMLATLQRLGVAGSRSRPAVSNDNPFSEALFRTLKYRPRLPVRPLQSLLQARRWVTQPCIGTATRTGTVRSASSPRTSAIRRSIGFC